MKLTRQQILKFLFTDLKELERTLDSKPAILFDGEDLYVFSVNETPYSKGCFLDKITCLKFRNKISFDLDASNYWYIEFELDGEWLKKNKTYNLEDLLLEKNDH